MLDRYDEQNFQDLLADMKQKSPRAPRSRTAREVIGRLFAKKGYAQVQQRDQLEQLWAQAVGGQHAKQTRCGRLMRGVLEVVVSNSLVLSELTFSKRTLLDRLHQHPDGKGIKDLKFKLGAID